MSENQIEAYLKPILEKLLREASQVLRSPEELKELQGRLRDYTSSEELAKMIEGVISFIMGKVVYKLSCSVQQEDYRNLETLLQKNQLENRNHIRAEQQLKLFVDNIQEKLNESEQSREELLISTKQMINALKKDNQSLSQQLAAAKAELNRLKQSSSAAEKPMDIPALLIQRQMYKTIQVKRTGTKQESVEFTEHQNLTHLSQKSRSSSSSGVRAKMQKKIQQVRPSTFRR